MTSPVNTMQNSLFDAIESQRHADVGMNIAAENNAVLLTRAREIAKEIANKQGEVTADDVQMKLIEEGHHPHALGNAAGSLFRGREWEWTGKMVKSARIHAHANKLNVWRLK